MEQYANNIYDFPRPIRDGDKGNILDNLLSRMEQYANSIYDFSRSIMDGDKGNILDNLLSVPDGAVR